MEKYDKKYLLKILFKSLESIQYCVLRNYSELPYSYDHDIDIYVSKNDRVRLKKTLKRIAESHNIDLIQTYRNYQYETIILTYFSDKGIEFIKLDIWWGITYRGINYFSNREILENITTKRGVKVLNSNYSTKLIFLKDVIHNKRIIKSTDVEKVTSMIQSEKKFQRMFKKLPKDLLEQRCTFTIKMYRMLLIAKHLLRNNVLLLYSIPSYFVLRVRNLFRWNFIVLIGPDGSGKTTTYEFIKMKVEKILYDEVIYKHGRFKFYKDLNEIFNKRSKTNEYTMGNVNSRGKFREYLKIIFYLPDYILGYFYILIQSARNKLVIQDRYFYDYLYQPEYDSLNKKLLRLLSHVIPKPRLLLFLDCPPGRIHNRKPELSVDEIFRQQNKIKMIFKNYLRVDTGDIENLDYSLLMIIKKVI